MNIIKTILASIIGLVGVYFFSYRKGKKDQEIREAKRSSEQLLKEYQENEEIDNKYSRKSIDDRFDGLLRKKRENSNS